MNKSIFQSIADEIKDREEFRNDVLASLHFFNGLLNAETDGRIDYKQSNFFIAQETDNMDRITKLATLLPTKLTITNTCRYIKQITHGCFYNDEVLDYVDYEIYGFLPSGDFRSWLNGALPLLNAGIISYYPNTVTYLQYPDGSEKAEKKYTIENIETCAFSGQITNNEYNLSRVAELEIPYIYDISLSDYGKISVENMGALKNFRTFFAKCITGIDFQKKGEVADFQYELSRNVKNIEVMYKKEIMKLSGGLAIGTLATVAASLMIFRDFGALCETILGVAGGGGILQACNNIFAYQVEKVTIKNEDCYFLWLLRK